MRAYSQDLRERVLRAVDLGHQRTEIVQLFGISLTTLNCYVKQRRKEGYVRSKAIPGRPPTKRAEAGSWRAAPVTGTRRCRQHCTMWEQAHDECVSWWTHAVELSNSLTGPDQKSRLGQRSAMRRNGSLGERTRPAFVCQPVGREGHCHGRLYQVARRGELTDEQWEGLHPLLPPQKPKEEGQIRAASDHQHSFVDR
jgi:hypothetical protein